jgi:hypothetical protein
MLIMNLKSILAHDGKRESRREKKGTLEQSEQFHKSEQHVDFSQEPNWGSEGQLALAGLDVVPV